VPFCAVYFSENLQIFWCLWIPFPDRRVPGCLHENNIFSSEVDVFQFLQSRQEGLTSDYGIESLITFPYATSEARGLASAALAVYLPRLQNRFITRVAAFLEAAGYVPAAEPLMRLRNRLESEYGECGPGTPGHEMVVAVRNAALALSRKVPTAEVSISHSICSDRDSLAIGLEKAVKLLEIHIAGVAGHLRKALEYAHSDPGASLVKTRQVFEKVLLDAYSQQSVPPKRSAINGILCDTQFTQGLDPRVFARMRHLQELGNIAAHGHKVLPADATRALEDVCEVVEWYLTQRPLNCPE
jgi:hypothetical protein